MLQDKSKTVQDYKVEQADKYSLGMAINNAAILTNSEDYTKENMKDFIKELFELYKEVRKEILGY